MHGIVMSELCAFVTAHAGDDGWTKIATKAGLGERSYLPVGTYPDEEALSIVSAACRELRVDASRFLRDFGRHLVLPLVKTYGPLLKPAWKSLEVLENTEHMVHAVVRRNTVGAAPPTLSAVRTQPNEVVVHYRSGRRLCHLAVGIVEGLGDVFSENLDVSQRRCMLDGDPECQLVVRRLPPSGPQKRETPKREG
jgi:predicted hydrocarbon binding protein